MKRLLTLSVLLLLILFTKNIVFADSTSSPDSAPVNVSTDQEITPEKNYPLWVSYASNGESESVGYFARRMGENKNEALELTYIIKGADRGYGIDYFRFYDLPNDSAWFLGIGWYAVHVYYDHDTRMEIHDKVAFSLGYQKIFYKCLLGLGFNTVRGFYIQLGAEL